MFTLYSDRFWISPWVFTCFVALTEKGLPFTVTDLALDKYEARTPQYRKRTLTGKVPALDHDGFVLGESHAIVEYLEELAPELPVLPSDRQQRARARQLMGFLRTDLHALRNERSSESIFYRQSLPPLSAAAQADAQKLAEVAADLLPEGATSLFGAWTIADSELAFCLQRLAANGEAIPAPLQAFVDAQWARPSVQAYATHPRPPYVKY